MNETGVNFKEGERPFLRKWAIASETILDCCIPVCRCLIPGMCLLDTCTTANSVMFGDVTAGSNVGAIYTTCPRFALLDDTSCPFAG